MKKCIFQNFVSLKLGYDKFVYEKDFVLSGKSDLEFFFFGLLIVLYV